MSRILGVVIVVGLVLAGAAYAGSPLLAFEQLKAAARSGDRDRLEALVDFPAVREDLKHQVDSKVVKLAREASGVSFPAVMALGRLGAMIGDRAVDKLITPQAISAMVTEGRSPRRHAEPSDQDPTDGTTPKVSVHYAYLSPDRFRVALSPADRPDTAVALIMDRRGLFSWRVEGIELPR